MRKPLLFAWVLLPIGAWAFHEGPGQDLMALDDAGRLLRRAHAQASAEEWAAAVDLYQEAIKILPKDRRAETWRARLELDKARMLCHKLPVAHADLKSLVDEIAADPSADPGLLADARSALASSQYYMTWLMRLEGLPREKWEPEVEAARQGYRRLAEQAEAAGDPKAKRHREDLESAVRLARMELKDLQGLPLPSQ
jgi:hypothetical protein